MLFLALGAAQLRPDAASAPATLAPPTLSPVHATSSAAPARFATRAAALALSATTKPTTAITAAALPSAPGSAADTPASLCPAFARAHPPGTPLGAPAPCLPPGHARCHL